MVFHSVPIIRCGLLSASLVAIVAGWCLSVSAISVVGAILCVISFQMWYIVQILVSAHFRSNPDSAKAELNTLRSRTASVLTVIILGVGFVGVLYGVEDDMDMLFAWPGAIIWCAEFGAYMLHGIVCEKCLGIRLTLRPYSGWHYIGRCRSRPRLINRRGAQRGKQATGRGIATAKYVKTPVFRAASAGRRNRVTNHGSAAPGHEPQVTGHESGPPAALRNASTPALRALRA